MVTVVTVTTARGNHASVATLVEAWTGTSRRETGTQAEREREWAKPQEREAGRQEAKPPRAEQAGTTATNNNTRSAGRQETTKPRRSRHRAQYSPG